MASVDVNEQLRVRLAITCGKSSGVLASIVVAMRKIQLQIDDQQLQDMGDYRVVEIKSSASKPELIELRRSLLSLADVIDVKAFVVKSKSAKEAPANQASTQSTMALSNNELLSKLELNFPNVASTIIEYSGSLEHDVIPDTLFRIGKEFAEHRHNSLNEMPTSAGIAETMNGRIIPDLKDIATLEYAEEGYETGLKVMVSDFTRPELKADKSNTIHTFGSLEAEVLRCDFLAGYIEGLMQSNPSTSQVSVSETHCRNEGHPYCLFECS